MPTTSATASGIANATIALNDLESERLAKIVQICFTIILCAIMFGVGCAGDFLSIIKHFRKPSGICTGIFNQFVIMPLLALVFVHATQMDQAESMAVLIQGTAPGGMMSNIVTYWMKGDINLSISMTSLSTLIALGTMPLWLFIFTKILNVREELQIPFSSLGIALAAMVFPVIIGLLVRRFKPKVAKILTNVLTLLGTVAIVVTLIVSGLLSKLSFLLTWKQWLVAALSPITGIGLGYLTSSLPFLDLTTSSRRTIAIETGLQNCQIAQSVLVISYALNISVYEKVRLYPLLSSGFQISFGVIIAVVLNRLRARKLPEIDQGKPDKTGCQPQENSNGANENNIDMGMDETTEATSLRIGTR